ncbi:hypothetical protein JOD43_003917 [Pullulanibacillus pueri]|uniref:Transcriptional regulator n=1 Tax=Pullulanibacillus pueri TaxID=1437324 RepID=A0A8J2ZXX0_9BACL|nr:XRE family transcriptional regulator [Pullulanibacillus pueri]MBM7683737.1 hypothetical protein [Pullulanibacillus pueri]GGH85120.1 transcriptional regulator [Pullulanibacillus pueri]
MGKIKFTLGETIEKMGDNITKNKIAVESKVRPATIASLVNGDARRIELDTLINILDALNNLNDGNEKIGIHNIIDYEK